MSGDEEAASSRRGLLGWVLLAALAGYSAGPRTLAPAVFSPSTPPEPW